MPGAVDQYAIENTVIYHIIKNSLDLSGAHYDSDASEIDRLFNDGRMKDGFGLRKWALAFDDSTLVGVIAKNNSYARYYSYYRCRRRL